MLCLRHAERRAVALATSASTRFLLPVRSYASRIDIPFTPPPFSTVDSCPSPSCQCRETPAGLDVERQQNLNGSMASYAEQVLISTGRGDWKSRIEDEDDAVLVKRLKSLIGPRGKYSDPYHRVMITNSSFLPTSPPPKQSGQPSHADQSNPGKDTAVTTEAGLRTPPASAYLLPTFQYVPIIPTDPPAVEEFVKAFVLPARLHQAHDVLSKDEKNVLLRESQRQNRFVGLREINEILVLICGHGSRDDRCGIIGPVLKEEFEDKLRQQDITLLHDEPGPETEIVNPNIASYTPTARVALISHIGGHKWAGNVIIYIPPSFTSNPLHGKGIWYGRVGPEHVEGIVAQTIMQGTVIKDMFRGAIDRHAGVVRL